MKLGFFTMPMHPPGSDMSQTLQDDVEQIVVLDKLGYAEAWIGEHFTAAWENVAASSGASAPAASRATSRWRASTPRRVSTGT